MDANIKSYIELSFQKIRKIKDNEKGEVWLATDKSGRVVILKYIALVDLPYRILKEKNFSLCPRIFHTFEDEDQTIVVEEYAYGETLLDRIGRGEYLTEEEAKIILLKLADGLAPIHAAGIIHRDITPSNLILQPGNAVKLIDFDAARTIKEHKAKDTHFLGTIGYAPPEQFGYGQTDERSDIYSIGITFQKSLPEDYRGYLTKILAKCAAIDPGKRYQNVKELKRAIIFRSSFQKWGRKLAVACAIAVFAITFTSRTIESPKEEITEETSKAAVAKTTALPEKQEAPKEQTKIPPVESVELVKAVETAEVAPIPQSYSSQPATNKVEENATEGNKTEVVMKCPQIIEPPKISEPVKPNNNFAEELEERYKEREEKRKRAMVKMMLDSLPPNMPQEQKDRALKEYLKIIELDKYP